MTGQSRTTPGPIRAALACQGVRHAGHNRQCRYGPLCSVEVPGRLRADYSLATGRWGGSVGRGKRAKQTTHRIAPTGRAVVVSPEGFEPPTSWFVAKRSVQLSYGDNYRCLTKPTNETPASKILLTNGVVNLLTNGQLRFGDRRESGRGGQFRELLRDVSHPTLRVTYLEPSRTNRARCSRTTHSRRKHVEPGAFIPCHPLARPGRLVPQIHTLTVSVSNHHPCSYGHCARSWCGNGLAGQLRRNNLSRWLRLDRRLDAAALLKLHHQGSRHQHPDDRGHYCQGSPCGPSGPTDAAEQQEWPAQQHIERPPPGQHRRTRAASWTQVYGVGPVIRQCRKCCPGPGQRICTRPVPPGGLPPRPARSGPTGNRTGNRLRTGRTITKRHSRCFPLA